MRLVCSMFFKPSSLIFPSIQEGRRNKPHFLHTDRRNERRDGSHQMDSGSATKHLLRVVPTLQYDICIVMLYQYVRRSVSLGVLGVGKALPNSESHSFQRDFVCTCVNRGQFFVISRAICVDLSTAKPE